ncbi:hypothetical protein J31TS4_35130 [Paenibacillus sp. J31TS4]|uniref:hypothetical protein n=1 Tax=Paenibacillus sp. J31TS4 TaxID=2807195 RepID=UPI001B014091|nr:hypothetical protein [Paenibacillus sp. J31TS4]GIP40233.1 hypothetical protein J31TS4_35130 [Paenibacillus sp. J31TS4]
MSKSSMDQAEKANVSGLLQMLPGLGRNPLGFSQQGAGFPQQGAGFPAFGGGPAKSGGGFAGMLGSLGAGMKLGWGMLRFIMPLLGGFKL